MYIYIYKLYIYIYSQLRKKKATILSNFMYVYVCMYILHYFYCCFLFSFGLFKLNIIKLEQYTIEPCSNNIVLNWNGSL